MTVVNNDLDTGVPEITVNRERVKVSIKSDDAEILRGITAEDSRDGDVTDSLVVESLSNFIEKGVRKASIVAFDSDNHIARASREIEYTDYTSPRFSLEEPLIFSMNNYDFMGSLKVEDCLDGDITAKLHLYYNEDVDYQADKVKVTYSVSNSVGDVVSLPVTIARYDPSDSYGKPQIELTDYLIYTDGEQEVDPMTYLQEINMSGRTYKKRKGKMQRMGTNPKDDPEYLTDEELVIEVGDPVDGVYEISYTVNDARDEEDDTDDTTNTVRLIVITEDR